MKTKIKDDLYTVMDQLLNARQFTMANSVAKAFHLITKLERTAAKLEHKRKSNVQQVRVLNKKVKGFQKGLRKLSKRTGNIGNKLISRGVFITKAENVSQNTKSAES